MTSSEQLAVEYLYNGEHDNMTVRELRDLVQSEITSWMNVNRALKSSSIWVQADQEKRQA